MMDEYFCRRFVLLLIFICVGEFTYSVSHETFVLDHKKKKVSTVRVLKEQYAEQLADRIHEIPDLHKDLADLQKMLIEELRCVVSDEVGRSKKDVTDRLKKVKDLCAIFDQLGKDIHRAILSLKKSVS